MALLWGQSAVAWTKSVGIWSLRKRAEVVGSSFLHAVFQSQILLHWHEPTGQFNIVGLFCYYSPEDQILGCAYAR